ncbi:MAG: hypothetical protein ACE14M_06150 [Terriglobales bacterium]
MPEVENLETPAESLQQPIHVRQHISALLSPVVQRVLDLRYIDEPPAVLINCLGVACGLRPTPERGLWLFVSPWWQSLIPEDARFEQRLLTEVGKVQQHIQGMLQNLDLSKVN